VNMLELLKTLVMVTLL